MEVWKMRYYLYKVKQNFQTKIFNKDSPNTKINEYTEKTTS